jgi:branched-chain amino acid transport system substrate-binding protein
MRTITILLSLIVQAVKKAGPKRVKLCSALARTKQFIGISGAVNFSVAAHNGLTKDAFVMVTVRNTDWMLAK